jgi:NADH-ubiquinone oxidoreductase chain 4
MYRWGTMPNERKDYTSVLISWQVFIIITFTVSELILFYVLIEETLIPNLIIMTWWSNQIEH